jgi:hypothetical protein
LKTKQDEKDDNNLKTKQDEKDDNNLKTKYNDNIELKSKRDNKYENNNNKLNLIYSFDSNKLNCLIARKYLMINEFKMGNENKKNKLKEYIKNICNKYRFILNNQNIKDNIDELVNNLF